jgi:hypothetical protein
LLFATGVMTLFAGQHGDAWVFGAHGVGGFALAGVLGWKLRRVWRRLAQPRRWDRGTAAGAGALSLVVATLLSGVGWSSGLELSAGGYNLLGWHFALGIVLTVAVAVHAVLRAKPLRHRDVVGRRQFLRAGGLAAGSYLVWELQRPLSAWVGLRGARRRFTGSYEADSFAGNTFPSTSWVADSPPPAAGRLLSPRAGRAGRSLAAPHAGGASGPRHAGGHARLHRRLLLAPALERRAPRPPARAGRPAV